MENPLAPYFDIEDQNGNFKFTPTEAWRSIIEAQGKRTIIMLEPFIMIKNNDTVKLSMNTDETQPLTPTWQYKDKKWKILSVSRYVGCFFDGHIKGWDNTCPRCGYEFDDN